MIAQSAEVASADSSALWFFDDMPPSSRLFETNNPYTRNTLRCCKRQSTMDSEQIPSVGVYAIP